MKTLSLGRLLSATLMVAASTATCLAQSPGGYVAPALYGQPMGPPPGMPASPLAGGAAAYGNAMVDAHGNPIVMQASYLQGCGPGQGCGPMGYGGYGDPGTGYADFGGYGMDQVGPHYFDVSVEAVFLAEEELLSGSQSFGSVGAGANAPRVLNPSNSGGDYDAGWQIAGRLDLGPLSVFEGTYMGLYDIGFTDTVRSVDVTNPSQDFQLFSAFSNFGVPTPLAGIDDGSVYTLGYESELESVELSYRRYWVGHNPRVSGTWLLGFRYLKLSEDLTFQTQSLINVSELATSTRSWSSGNDLLGFQFGGDGWVGLRQGLRIGTEGKVGIYNNRFSLRNFGDFAAAAGAPSDFDVTVKDDQVAFAGEWSVNMVADILPSVSLRGGYRLLYLNSLASASGSVDYSDITAAVVADQQDALFHGFSGGIEYVW
jgi:hypothetical protein